MKAQRSTPLYLFTVLSFGISSAVSAKVLDRVRAVVGTTPILQSDVSDRLGLIQSSPVYSNILGIDSKKTNEASILEMMIEEEIITTVTEELNLAVTDSEVQKQIDSIAKQNNVTRDQLSASLKNEGIPFEAYANNIRNQLQKRSIFERELRASASTSESELRNEYYKHAQSEYNLVVLDVPSKEQSSVLKSFKKGQTKWDDVALKYPTTELGWIQPENLKKDLADAVQKSSTGNLIGPHSLGTKSSLIFISAERKGSEEEFEAVRPQLAAKIQSVSFNERFKAWVDTKKKSMQIVENK